ncbi:MAG: hypothetical protein JSW27_09655 [Phycisphaerales bacterium]|nr:MAG: hypothetical protein JSW27_09655 [Phycisphaerales bacterium]
MNLSDAISNVVFGQALDCTLVNNLVPALEHILNEAPNRFVVKIVAPPPFRLAKLFDRMTKRFARQRFEELPLPIRQPPIVRKQPSGNLFRQIT